MAEYIECEAVYRFAQEQKKKETGAYSKGWNHAMDVIKSAVHNKDAIPAADVMEVVRCEDCKNCEWKTDTCTYGWCREQNRSMMRHEYCSDGVKREAEHG